MYVGGFFVDIAEISKISSVNCGLYPFRNEISFFEILTLSQLCILVSYTLLEVYCTELRGNQHSR